MSKKEEVINAIEFKMSCLSESNRKKLEARIILASADEEDSPHTPPT